jgi:hypothetical protein
MVSSGSRRQRLEKTGIIAEKPPSLVALDALHQRG